MGGSSTGSTQQKTPFFGSQSQSPFKALSGFGAGGQPLGFPIQSQAPQHMNAAPQGIGMVNPLFRMGALANMGTQYLGNSLLNALNFRKAQMGGV